MRALRLTDRRRLVLRVIALCLFISGTVLFLDARDDLYDAELWTVDRRFQIRGPRHALTDTSVVVVGVDDYSLNWMAMEERIGSWPWPRSVHASLVKILSEAGARVIAFDVLFPEPDHHSTVPEHPSGLHGVDHDAALASALRQSGRVILAIQETRSQKLTPAEAGDGAASPPANDPGRGGLAPMASTAQPILLADEQIQAFQSLARRGPRAPSPLPDWLQPPTHELLWTIPWDGLATAARATGYIDIDADPDSVYRRVQPVKAVDNGRLHVHLAVATAAAALGVPLDQVQVQADGAVRLGNQRTLPVNPDGKMWIDFASSATRRTGPGRREMAPSAFPYVSFYSVLSGNVSPSLFRDKVVLVGAVAPGLRDVRPNPFDVAGSGVDLNAHLVDAILENTLPRQTSAAVQPLLMLTLVLLLCWALALRTPLGATVATLGITLPFLIIVCLLFSHAKLIVPVATPMLTIAACYTGVMTLRFATEQREQRRVRRFFERYVTQEVATEILEDPEAAQLGGRRREVTMLFSDIRGFTSMSEQLSAEVVIEILNEYFGVMVPIIERHRGTTNNFIGDAIFAFWGAPLAQADQAERAVLTGLEMLEAMPALQARWREQGLPAFEIGIGIHTGTAVIGNIGTEQRSHYTTIGDDVNIASRLESANSKEGTKFLISDAVYHRVAHLIEARQMPPLWVKNKAEPLSVYEVLGRKQDIAVESSAEAAATG
jgi:adenylate cyclase